MSDDGPLAGFLASLPFTPDRFQVEAIGHIAAGMSVVVSAPTGAGKTLIAEAAVEMAKRRGRRAFYTTPIKALSNQKFGDLRAVHGDEAVGLLTGDDVVNGDAAIVVMTTEVLRNMIYADSDALDDLAVVILDEVHYLQDRYRGSVWEEVIIHLDRQVQLVNLSATVANAEEFTDWVRARRGPTALVEETHRPVPLESMYMLEDRHREGAIELLPVFDRKGARPNPAVVRMLAKGRGRRPRFAAPRRLEVTSELRRLGLLPAIYFIFSRAGCDQAAGFVASARLGLTDAGERQEIRTVAEAMTAHLSVTDLAVLGYAEWLSGLEEGVAAHHAGLVPAFKQAVEALFSAGLLRIVFATETLALGINMPARSVVLERLSKFNGESHELLQPGDYTQLTGRAGRRGIDTVGTAVVLHQRDLPFERVAGIAGRGAHPLVSSFAPSYNMAVNLVARYTRERAEELLRASFAQHRIRTRNDELGERIAERRTDAATFRRSAACDRGDIEAFVAGDAGDVRELMRGFAQGIVAGQVLSLPDGDGSTRWAVVARGYGANPRLLLVSETGEVRRQLAGDLQPAAAVVGTVILPEPFRPRERSYQRQVAEALQATDAAAPVAAIAGSDPVAACPRLAEHLGWLERARKAEREIARLERRLAGGNTDDLVARFRALIGLLEDRGYLKGWELTLRGERLRQVYNELDLLVVEAVEEGVFSGLDAAELAGVLSAFVYEPRRTDTPGAVPTAAVGRAVDRIMELSDAIAMAEDRRGIAMMRPPDDGYAERIHGWASGATLDDLFDDEAAAGDFVRIARQTLDLLRQVRDTVGGLRLTAASAIEAIDRGVVAAGGHS